MNQAMNNNVVVIGAGLAGSEAAWQIARRGVAVTLYEMRPAHMTPAHHTGLFAELVCSNSLRSDQLASGPGLLKEELRRMGSLVMEAADACRVPAGSAQAVNRDDFSAYITEKIRKHPLITVVEEEVTGFDSASVTVCASGPLTSDALYESIRDMTGQDTLYFYDAAAPIVTAESIDMDKAFWQSRYNKGDGNDYLNCPLDAEDYRRLYDLLAHADRIATHDFEKEIFFEGCMPVETMVDRGYQTLLFGPLKPVGLTDPRTGKTPFAVVQLRKEDAQGRLLNLVGFQTRTKWGDQAKVIHAIPALEHAEIVRYGVMHRNTFMNGPKLLKATGQMKARENIFFAGQMTGVEGYIESTASGLICGMNAARVVKGQEPAELPPTTAMGCLMQHVSQASPDNYQPMNINFGLMPPPAQRIRSKKDRSAYYAKRALKDLDQWKGQHHEG
jgi:methylenetetrahydrofolate--tRNA-(uracil-5-)-methyltransferase